MMTFFKNILQNLLAGVFLPLKHTDFAASVYFMWFRLTL